MAQTYTDPTAQRHLANGVCPECGEPAVAHTTDVRFWVAPQTCDLRQDGVTDRIEQYRTDLEQADADEGYDPAEPWMEKDR